MFGFILWIVMGGFAGWIAAKLLDSPQGMLANIMTGIAGGFIGGLVMRFFGNRAGSGFNLYNLFVSVVGAVIFLLILRFLSERD